MTTLLVILASTITLTAPENGATYETHTPCMKEFLANPEKRSNPRPPEPPLSEEEEERKKDMDAKFKAWEEGGCQGKAPKRWDRRWNYYERNEWTEDLYKRSEEEARNIATLFWKADFPIKQAKLEYSEFEDFHKSITENVYIPRGKKEALEAYPLFLKVNTKYWWRVKANDPEGKEVVSDVRTFTTADAFPRIIGYPYWNWRDHGGGVNADGKRIRQGMIYRTNAPLNDNGEESGKATVETSREMYVNKLGIKSQADLRGEGEAEAAEKNWGRIRLDKCGINVKYFPVDPYHLEGGTKANYVKAIKFFANKDNYPILYNCAAGCDRTGSIGVLLDGILNRTDEQIYDDYELPSFTPFAPRLRYCRKGAGMFSELDGKTGDYGGKNIRENVVNYLLKAGVTQEDIDNIRKIMIED